MKHLTFAGAAILCIAAPLLAQPNPSGPVQLHNPHRGGDGGLGGGGGGFSGGFGYSGPGSFGPESPIPAPMQAPPQPPVTMLADGAYLFILRGNTLMQFDKKTLRLLNSVELPHPTNGVEAYDGPPQRPMPAPGVEYQHIKPGPAF